MRFRSILVITYGRSGSTLLQGVLNAIPNVVVRGENYDFCWGLYRAWKSLCFARERYGEHGSHEPTHPWYGACWLDPERFLRSAREAMVEQLNLARDDGELCWGFKEIRYIEHLEELPDYLEFLGRLLPETAFIFNTRLHEEVCKSAFWKKQDPTKVTARLRAADRRFFEFAMRHENAFVVRFERLCEGWDACADLFDFLGAYPERERFESVLSRPHSLGYTQPTLVSAQARRARNLTPRVIPSELTLLSPPKKRFPDAAPRGSVTVFSVVRNELSGLSYFLSYYRALGCSRFVFIDNESVDGTVEFLAEQPDVVLYSAPHSQFASSRSGRNWVNSLTRVHALGAWALCADADELLAWPGDGQEGLRGLVARAKRLGLNRVFTPMLDAYSEYPADELASYESGAPFGDICCWIDPINSYRAVWRKGRLVVYGGPRARFAAVRQPGPIMTKQSLYLVEPSGYEHTGCHFDTYATPSPLVAPFLHYKFMPGFAARVERAIEEGQHWDNASEYRGYREQSLSGRTLKLSDSVRVRSSSDLKNHIAAFTKLIRDAGLCGSEHLRLRFDTGSASTAEAGGIEPSRTGLS
jgi:hypothetical protein